MVLRNSARLRPSSVRIVRTSGIAASNPDPIMCEACGRDRIQETIVGAEFRVPETPPPWAASPARTLTALKGCCRFYACLLLQTDTDQVEDPVATLWVIQGRNYEVVSASAAGKYEMDRAAIKHGRAGTYELRSRALPAGVVDKSFPEPGCGRAR
jgi:hypothetical protein